MGVSEEKKEQEFEFEEEKQKQEQKQTVPAGGRGTWDNEDF